MSIRTVLCLVLVLQASGALAKSCGKGHIADNKECHVDKPPTPHEHKGKPCGNSYIAHDKICHIGQVAHEKPKAAPVTPKVSPAIIAAPIAAAAAVHAISKPAKLAKPIMVWGVCKKDVKLTVFSTAYDLMCFDNPLMCRENHD